MDSSIIKQSLSRPGNHELLIAKYLEQLQLTTGKCYVYVLKLKDNTYYTGLSSKIADRYVQHHNGRSKSTRYKRPLTMVALFETSDRKSARLLEVRIKQNSAYRFLMSIQKQYYSDDSMILFIRYSLLTLDIY